MNVIGQRRPLTLRLVRRLHRGVRRHQRIPQLAHSLLPSDVISHNLIHHRLSVFVMAVYRPTTWAQLGLAHTSVLGVTLDSTLSLNKHTSSICQSMYFHVGALRHVRSTLTEDTAAALAVTLVQSQLDYANCILFKTSTSNIKKFQRAKNTLARLVLPFFRFTSVASLVGILIF